MTGLRDGTPEEAGLSASRLACASELGASFVEHGDHPALVVLVARHGVVALHEAFGKLGPEPDDRPLPRDALFRLASVAKPITATATMILVEEGRIGLTRPVRDYLPAFRGDGKNDVYVHQLLTHTSGIQLDMEEWVLLTAARPDRPDHDPAVRPIADVLLQLAYERPLRSTPGEMMWYDNLNYELLAEIVRRVSGQPFEDFVQERIFDPLGMIDSHAIVPEGLLGRVVRAIPESLMGWVWGESLPTYASGCSGFLSTARDIAAFGQAFLDGGRAGAGRILGPATVREMTTNQIPGVPGALVFERHDEASWGYGWGIDCGEKWAHSPTFPRGTFWHSGVTGVGLWCDPTNDVVSAFFSAMTKEQRPNVGLLQSDLFVNAVTAAIDD